MLLSVQRLTCGYGSRPVLKDLSLEIAPGEFVAVVGPNGSGKSTFVRAISGTLAPASGRVLLRGTDLSRMHPREIARVMAVVSQETAVSFDFTVEEIVMMGRLPYQRRFGAATPRDRHVTERAMMMTRTLHLRDRLITAISGGERQRVLLARALAQEPELLILDEPTAHLDIAHQVELLDLIRRLNRDGLTVVAVLHDLNLASLYADRLVVIKEGRLYVQGPPAEVVTEAMVSAVYGSRVRVVPHPEGQTPHVILLSGGTAGGSAAGLSDHPGR
ncbi:MAG TPA: heme ABC transporter ATP-binding protein [Symbiobacteriaceae bacterium]